MSLVTIRGQLGSGASEAGRQIADRLQANYVDREIIAEVATRLHREEREVIAKEMPPTSLLGRIAEALERSFVYGDGMAGAYLPVGEIPLDNTRYLQALESVVRELVRSQPLVILGRGSQFILKGYPGILHVLAVAPIEVRVERVMRDRRLLTIDAGLAMDRVRKIAAEIARSGYCRRCGGSSAAPPGVS